MKKVTGELAGLKPSEKQQLEAIFDHSIQDNQLVSLELAEHLVGISCRIGRQVGVLVNRQGRIEHTFVGGPERIYLPDIGRSRASASHLRGLRHIHTVLGQAELKADDLADLTKLRLDCVCAIEARPDGQLAAIQYAYLLPGTNATPYRRVSVDFAQALDVQFIELVEALEDEHARYSGRTQAAPAAAQAVILGIYANQEAKRWRLSELRELAQTAGVRVVDTLSQLRQKPDPRFLVGRGKLEEAVLRCLDLQADILLVDNNLTPAQARAMAAFSELKVIDRTQLILDIFAQHAHSRDGKLQVELAQLKYTLPRLTDLDAGLSRLSGGIGGRGPGETKLEINRRRARDRITRLEREIDHLSQQRDLRRQRRQSGTQKVVCIIGYTNAGKSTLLNQLTGSEAWVADQLFATLDTTSRRLYLPNGQEVVLTDTVGFIRELPPDLVKAFRATLEELQGADLLLHVVDISDDLREEKIAAVQQILQELHLATIPSLLVLNKADQVPQFVAHALANKLGGVACSAQENTGLKTLLATMTTYLTPRDLAAQET